MLKAAKLPEKFGQKKNTFGYPWVFLFA